MSVDPNLAFNGLVLLVAGGPALLLVALGLPPLLGLKLSERFAAGLSRLVILVGLLALVGIAGLFWTSGAERALVFKGSDWVVLEEVHFHFRLELIFDWLSIPFAILSYGLCGLIAAFAANYMHREPGYQRFFFLFAMFLLGINTAVLAGSIETLFLGWELVGLSSALLVAFFQERVAPVDNGLRVWSVYRFADAAFLMGAALLHHLTGEGEFARLAGTEGWPNAAISLPEGQALLIGLLMIVAAAGKSALVPFSGWLPRAMEGPTPSSAIFYGALSIHLGTYLLLRLSPLLDRVPALSWLVLGLGLITVLIASLAGRVQSDVKSALAFASLTQVGLIAIEIGLGLRYLPLLHMIGHACLRTLQLLRAPTLLRDYQLLENALGRHVSNRRNPWPAWLSAGGQIRLYRWGLERGYLDTLLDRWLVRPFLAVFRWCDRAERKWTDLLSGRPSRESDLVRPTDELLKELR
ncbi:MAG: proton-conducting transporter membrane subunit [Planctomycetota bacterium]|jgi:NADH-quinone oxidoreductase subunit L